MIEHLSPGIRQEVEPMWLKWPGFVQKFNARVHEVIAEAEGGLDGLIEQHALDHGPMAAAFGAVQARFHSLSTKFDESSGKIEELLWEIMFRDDMSPQDSGVLSTLHDDICRQQREQQEALDMAYESLRTCKNAQWARKLAEHAQAEAGKGLSCSNCGSPFALTVSWQASNETCPNCNAVNSVTPGAALYAYYGQGVHALAHEQAFEDWKGEQRVKKTFDDYRHPTAYDYWQYLQAARTYWTKYYQATQQMHPGFTSSHGSVEAAVEAKLKHYTAHDPVVDQQHRDFFGRLIDVARRQDDSGVRQLVAGMPDGIDLDECAEAAFERHDPQAAQLILNIKYDMDGEDEPRAAWLQEQLRDLWETVRDR